MSVSIHLQPKKSVEVTFITQLLQSAATIHWQLPFLIELAAVERKLLTVRLICAAMTMWTFDHVEIQTAARKTPSIATRTCAATVKFALDQAPTVAAVTLMPLMLINICAVRESSESVRIHPSVAVVKNLLILICKFVATVQCMTFLKVLQKKIIAAVRLRHLIGKLRNVAMALPI